MGVQDFNQLLTDDVRVHHKGAFYTAAAFQEEWGFPCSLFTEFQALSGVPSQPLLCPWMQPSQPLEPRWDLYWGYRLPRRIR